MTKKETSITKGVAIILMIIHHLWAFPSRIPIELVNLFSVFGTPITYYIGQFGKICVALFFFVGGYGLYFSSKNGFNIIARIKKILFAYWKVFVIFIPIAFLFFSKQPIYCENEILCNKYSEFNIKELVSNFFCITSSYNEEWWFLRSYIIAIITLPLVVKIVKRFSTPVNFALLICADIFFVTLLPSLLKLEMLSVLKQNALFTTFFSQSSYVICFWAGIIVAKDNGMTKVRAKMKEAKLLNPIVDLLGIIALIFFRQTYIGNEFDFVYSILFIALALDLIEKSKILINVFNEFGKRSTNMWLTHSFFCYYFYAAVKLVFCTNRPTIAVLIALLFSYLSSVILTAFWDSISKLFKLISKHTLKNNR